MTVAGIDRLRTLNESDEREDWVNAQTARVDSWLMAPEVRPIIVRLVEAWNEADGLGVDLADELRDLVTEKLLQDNSRRSVSQTLRLVNWNQLAEQYALAICGVQEQSLVGRLEAELERFRS